MVYLMGISGLQPRHKSYNMELPKIIHYIAQNLAQAIIMLIPNHVTPKNHSIRFPFTVRYNVIR